LPLESFAHPPVLIVEDAGEFLDHWLATMTPAEVGVWVKNRDAFLKVLEDKEISEGYTSCPISMMMRSPRSYCASVLDSEAIVGLTLRLDKKVLMMLRLDDIAAFKY
jgi:hypothetical protein